MGPTYGGVLSRRPYMSEMAYFWENPSVSGMASEDDAVVLNPFSPLNEKERDAVRLNEAARIYMRSSRFAPDFDLTEEQSRFLQNTPYGGNPEAARATIASRLLSGDPSSGTPTEAQRRFVEELRRRMGLR